MVFPLLSCVVSLRKFSFAASRTNLIDRTHQGWGTPGSCPALGTPLGHGDVLRGQRALLRALLSIPTVVLPAGTSPSPGTLGSAVQGCRGGDARPPPGGVQQKCRILTQTQTPAVRGNTGSLGRAGKGPRGHCTTRTRSPFTPLTGHPALAALVILGAEPSLGQALIATIITRVVLEAPGCCLCPDLGMCLTLSSYLSPGWEGEG